MVSPKTPSDLPLRAPLVDRLGALVVHAYWDREHHAYRPRSSPCRPAHEEGPGRSSVPGESGHRFGRAPASGRWPAFVSMYVGGGADATVIGSSMKELDFTHVQSAGETWIAAAAGVPPVIVGLSEGRPGTAAHRPRPGVLRSAQRGPRLRSDDRGVPDLRARQPDRGLGRNRQAARPDTSRAPLVAGRRAAYVG